VKSQKKIPLCYVCRVSINKKGLCNLQTITLRSKTADAQRRLSSQAGGGADRIYTCEILSNVAKSLFLLTPPTRDEADCLCFSMCAGGSPSPSPSGQW
jgi:hypothetical protein